MSERVAGAALMAHTSVTAVQAAREHAALAVEPAIDPIPLPVQLAGDPITTPVEPSSQGEVSARGGTERLPVELPIDDLPAAIECAIDPVSLAIEAPFDPVARGIGASGLCTHQDSREQQASEQRHSAVGY